MISWRPAARCAVLSWSTPACATRRRSIPSSPIAARTSSPVCANGYLKTLHVDLGFKFISRDLDPQACHRGVKLDLSRPGRQRLDQSVQCPAAGGMLERHGFLSLARKSWKLCAETNNGQRPHGAIGNKVPAALMKSAHIARVADQGRKTLAPAEGTSEAAGLSLQLACIAERCRRPSADLIDSRSAANVSPAAPRLSGASRIHPAAQGRCG